MNTWLLVMPKAGCAHMEPGVPGDTGVLEMLRYTQHALHHPSSDVHFPDTTGQLDRAPVQCHSRHQCMLGI